MIYASLKTIRQWHTALTPVNYLVLGSMSGAACLLMMESLIFGSQTDLSKSVVLCLIVAGAMCKLIYFYWIGKPAGSTINTATGFTQARVRLLDSGHSSDTFLTHEFGYDPGANKLLRLRVIMLLLVFIAPFLLLFQFDSPTLSAASTLIGLLIERWLFFAEARHVVRLFHGDQAT